MPYTTKTNPDEMTFDTSLQGYITAPYAELVELFGKPHDGIHQRTAGSK